MMATRRKTTKLSANKFTILTSKHILDTISQELLDIRICKRNTIHVTTHTIILHHTTDTTTTAVITISSSNNNSKVVPEACINSINILLNKRMDMNISKVKS